MIEKIIKRPAILLCICVAVLISVLAGCKTQAPALESQQPPDTSQETQPSASNETQSSDLPDVYIAEGSFAVGKLIPGGEDGPWQIAYGSFPHIECDFEMEPLVREFARRQLNPDGKLVMPPAFDAHYVATGALEAREAFLRKWEDAYSVLYSGEDHFDPDAVYFEGTPVNLLLLQNFTDDDRAYLESEGGRITTFEFARTGDALVFVTWIGNAIDGLSSEQFKDIMSGEATAWSQVGGEELPIVKYYSSGSLTLLYGHIMNGEEIAGLETDSHDVPGGTGEGGGYSYETYKDFVNEPGSIGVMSYSEAKDRPDVKILSLDGVAPDAETIASGEYPVSDSGFAVYWETDADAAPGLFADWLRSDEGKKLIIELGWMPVSGEQAS